MIERLRRRLSRTWFVTRYSAYTGFPIEIVGRYHTYRRADHRAAQLGPRHGVSRHAQ